MQRLKDRWVVGNGYRKAMVDIETKDEIDGESQSIRTLN